MRHRRTPVDSYLESYNYWIRRIEHSKATIVSVFVLGITAKGDDIEYRGLDGSITKYVSHESATAYITTLKAEGKRGKVIVGDLYIIDELGPIIEQIALCIQIIQEKPNVNADICTEKFAKLLAAIGRSVKCWTIIGSAFQDFPF